MKTKNEERRVKISEEVDIALATSQARILAERAGFKQTDQYMIATATSELARNMFLYAMKGEMNIRVLERKAKRGIEVVAEDLGPGINDIALAMKDHFSSSVGLGLGLPGVKRLMDEFVIDTKRRTGTKITVRKWL